MKMDSMYQVPVIHQDLRHEDSITQIADALAYLYDCMNDLFGRIEAKVLAQRNELLAIQNRSASVKTKLDKLRGSKKATKVVASAKYPAMQVYHDYHSIFENHPGFPLKRQNVIIPAKFPPMEKRVLEEKLQFYHVKVSKKLLHRNDEITVNEGLGSLPKHITSVTSLLLFNTTENPYKQYVVLDPLGSVRKARQQATEEEGAKLLEAAPLSISQKEDIKRPAGDNIFYAPGFGDVPQLDVPLDLPDLPGVADDLRYSLDSGPNIAPSVSAVRVTAADIKPEETSVQQQQPPVATLHSLFSDEPVLAPQPPKSVPHAPAMSPQPPPPPPLPTPAPLELNEARSRQKETKPPPATDMRASLMEAIRQAGGTGKAKLKSLAEQKTEAKKKKKEQKAIGSTGGDLMADLHAKLSLRRKGISGVNKGEAVSSAMEKISAMIPPPPRPEPPPASGNDDDSDWEV